MGIGDEIMASGHALTVHRQTSRRVRIVGKNGLLRWHELWTGLPWIVQKGEVDPDAISLVNGPQARPYIQYPFNRQIGQRYSGWRARDNVGSIHIPDDVRAFADGHAPREPFVIIEPHVPKQSNPNKQWGIERWQCLADILSPLFRVCQVGPAGTSLLRGVTLIETPTFVHGCAIIMRANKMVLPEGGLHHAAGALRLTSAVVLFGGAVDVFATGYPWHQNIAVGDPCGKWLPCEHCKSVWSKLTPEHVASVVTGERSAADISAALR